MKIYFLQTKDLMKKNIKLPILTMVIMSLCVHHAAGSLTGGSGASQASMQTFLPFALTGSDERSMSEEDGKSISQAIANDDPSVVDKLQELGIALDMRDMLGTGITPLHWAAANGNKKILGKLVEVGADVEAQDKEKRRPLHLASFNGHTEVVKILIGLGAEKIARDSIGMTPLHYAIRNKQEEVVKLFLRYKDSGKDIQDDSGASSLHWAVLVKDAEVIFRMLLDAGVPTELRAKNDKTPLHYAAERNQEALVEMLLDAGADVDASGEDGMRPLHYAVLGTDTSSRIIKMLLLRGGSASLKDSNKFSEANQKRVYNILKEYGFDHRALTSYQEEYKKLIGEYTQEFIRFLRSGRCGMPGVLAQLIFEYHNGIDMQLTLFDQAVTLVRDKTVKPTGKKNRKNRKKRSKRPLRRK